MLTTARRFLTTHRGSLVVVDMGTKTTRVLPVSDAPIVRTIAGQNGWFAVLHHDFTEPAVRRITLHHHGDPALAVASLDIDDALHVKRNGDAGSWQHVPGVFGLGFPYALHLGDESARVLRLPTVAGATARGATPTLIACPDDRHVISATTDGGRFVVYDLDSGGVVADRTHGHGPPLFAFGAQDVWLAHTDTVFRLDRTDWSVKHACRMRNRPGPGTISALAIDDAGARCGVAYAQRVPVPLLQPYRSAPVGGVVTVLDTDTMAIRAGCRTDRWVDALELDGDTVVMWESNAVQDQVRFASLEPFAWETYPPRRAGEAWH